MSVLDDITSGWGTKKTPTTQGTIDPTQPPQAGSVAKQVVNEYNASLNNPDNSTVKGIVPTVNQDGTVNATDNKPVYNVKENPVNTYRVAPVQTQPTETSPTTTSPVQDAYKSSVDQFINNYVPESDKQKEQREKRERRNKIFTSVADGIGALANIIGGVNGAKNANPNNISLTKAYQGRLDQFKQNRKENEQKYLYYLQKKDEAKRQADAMNWDRTKFAYDQNFKIGESKRDQANKDRDYDRYVNKDKEDADFKKLDTEYKDKQFKEEVRSHRATERLSAERNQISRQGSNKRNSEESINQNWAEIYNKYPNEAKEYEKKYNIGEGNGSMSSYTHAPTSWTAEQKKTFVAQIKQKYNSQPVSKSNSGFNIESYKSHNTSKKTTKPPLN